MWAKAATLMSPGTFASRDRGSRCRRLLERVLVRAPDPRTRAWSPEVLAAVDVPSRCSRRSWRDGADLDDHGGVRGGDRAGSSDDRRGRVRGRDGGDARRRRVRAGGGVRRRRDGGAGLRRVERTPRGPDDARRVPSARRPRRVAAREPRVRLGRQPAVVARPVRADRAGGRGRGARRRLRPPLEEAERVPPGAEGSCSCRACRGRWPPSGTGPRAACSTGSRSRTRART